MTIILDPETEARLHERAEREGQTPDALANALLADALADDPDDLTPEEAAEICAGIERGLADCDAGRIKPVAEWAAQLRQDFDLPAHLSDDELMGRQAAS